MRVSRQELSRMRRGMRQHMGHFELKDGTTYYYDIERAGGEVWAHALAVQIRSKYTDDIGEPPKVVRMLRQAKDPLSAIQAFRPDDPSQALVDPLVLLEHHPHTHEDGAEGVPDLSERSEYPPEA